MGVNEVFGNKLRQLREAAKLSQTEVARALDVSRGAISYYENAERVPGIDILDKVSFLFGVPLDYLLGRSENKKEEYVNIGLKTGLSDKAIKILEDGQIDIEVINKIMESQHFERVVDLIFEYYNCEESYSFKITDSSIEPDVQSYKQYVLSEYIGSLLFDSRYSYKSRNMTTTQIKESLKITTEKLDKIHESIEVMKADDEQRHEEFERQSAERRFENETEFERVMRIIIDKKDKGATENG
jgi:transcriptional regulator with XRE-family HTH domain